SNSLAVSPCEKGGIFRRRSNGSRLSTCSFDVITKRHLHDSFCSREMAHMTRLRPRTQTSVSMVSAGGSIHRTSPWLRELSRSSLATDATLLLLSPPILDDRSASDASIACSEQVEVRSVLTPTEFAR